MSRPPIYATAVRRTASLPLHPSRQRTSSRWSTSGDVRDLIAQMERISARSSIGSPSTIETPTIRTSYHSARPHRRWPVLRPLGIKEGMRAPRAEIPLCRNSTRAPISTFHRNLERHVEAGRWAPNSIRSLFARWRDKRHRSRPAPLGRSESSTARVSRGVGRQADPRPSTAAAF